MARSPICYEMGRGKDQGPGPHDEHPRGDILGLGSSRSSPVVSHGYHSQERPEVVGAGDDPALGGVEAETSLDGADHHVGENHALDDGCQTEEGQQPAGTQELRGPGKPDTETGAPDVAPGPWWRRHLPSEFCS